MRKAWKFVALSVGVLAVTTLAGMRAGRAAVIPTTVTLRGVSKTSDGRSFPYSARGTGTFDDVTGEITFSVLASNSLTFTGAGNVYPGTKNTFGHTTINGSNGSSGLLLIDGKINNRRRTFAGKFYSVIPNRLGPPPAGSVFTSGTVTIAPRT